jgi:F-type H+-transporting ATPase subunit b
MPLATNPLIQVTPGLMIWTVVCFLISLWVLKRYAFGPIQKLIDERRERIRQALEEADNARSEARKLLEEHGRMIAQAKSEAEEILSETRKVAEINSHACARRPRPSASGGSRRRADRSSPRRAARWSRSARRSPISA